MPTKHSQGTKEICYQEYRSGKTIAQLSCKYGISKSTLYRWIDEFRPVFQSKSQNLTSQEYVSITSEVQRLRQFVEIYTSTGITPKSSMRDRLATAVALREQYSINILLKAFDVNKSSYYSYLKNLPKETEHDKQDSFLEEEIRLEFEKAKGRYGAKKIHIKLQKRGIVVGVNRISRLMKEMNLSCHAQKPSRWTTENYKKSRLNLLQRNFNQSNPNVVWVSDFTYLKVRDTFYYLCAIIDLFSRKVISYHLSDQIDTDTLIYTFDQAYAERNCPKGLIFHSDQGIQYTNHRFREYLHTLGVTQSFSAPGYPLDNSVAESFFANLKPIFPQNTNIQNRYHKGRRHRGRI